MYLSVNNTCILRKWKDKCTRSRQNKVIHFNSYEDYYLRYILCQGVGITQL